MNAATEFGEERFAFGENWRRYLETVDDARIAEAERTLYDHLETARLDGWRVLDLGSGSGLFSLAAHRLGAREVVSIDHDLASVACTREMRSRYAPAADGWRVEHGDATDASAIAVLGTFDLVYSWGVLHHTGHLWQALDVACAAVAPGGKLFISIYNDQGARSLLWLRVKRAYHALPRALRTPYVVAVMAPREAYHALVALLRRHPMEYVRSWTHYGRNRGMSRWHDLVDWVGGHPFEVARPEHVVDRCRANGLWLERLRTVGGGLGCNEFVLSRPQQRSTDPEKASA